MKDEEEDSLERALANTPWSAILIPLIVALIAVAVTIWIVLSNQG